MCPRMACWSFGAGANAGVNPVVRHTRSHRRHAAIPLVSKQDFALLLKECAAAWSLWRISPPMGQACSAADSHPV